ncbi:MAG: sterol desaturase family protein [Bacteroidota bacterium]
MTNDPENRGKKKLFDNPVLELLTKSSPTVILGTYLPLIGAMIFYAYYQGYVEGVQQGLIWFGAALLTWTFFEYILHRFLFHLMEDHPKYHRVYYMLHGIHHDFPRDPNRLFMPPVAGLTLAFIFYVVFYLTIGTKVYIFLPGFVMGYVMYTMVHYSMHRFKPPRFLEPLWRHHHLHHYKYSEKGFGVSSMIWDHVFRTMPPEQKKTKKTGVKVGSDNKAA